MSGDSRPEDNDSEAGSSETGDSEVLRGLMIMKFVQGDNQIKSMTGMGLPVPRQGTSVSLTSRSFDFTDGEESNGDLESDGSFVVEDVSYEYSQAEMLEDQQRIETPLIVITVELVEE
jgi:hypothetical protein